MFRDRRKTVRPFEQSRGWPTPHFVSHTRPAVPHDRRRRLLDFAQIRREVGMRQVLQLIDWKPVSSHGDQLRGPCPIHRSVNPASRSFSVNTTKAVFHCFTCGATGNQLDLYAAVAGLSLYDAATELCVRAGVEPPAIATPQFIAQPEKRNPSG